MAAEYVLVVDVMALRWNVSMVAANPQYLLSTENSRRGPFEF